MKDLKCILSEGLLGDIEDRLDSMDSDIAHAINIPTVRDFKKHPFNNQIHMVEWNTPLLNKYKDKYPELFGEFQSLTFCIRKEGNHYIDVYPQLLMPSKTYAGFNTKYIPGWATTYVKLDVRRLKQFVIGLINKLAKDEKKLDEFFSHAAKCYNMQLKQIYDYPVRELDELI